MDFARLKRQFTQYFLIGILNFGISTGVLNLLCWWTNIYQGWQIILFSMIAFSVAVTNSYICNRLWTFREHKSAGSKYPLFYGLTALGALIGTGIIYMITTYIKAPFGISPKLWVNVANFVSLGFSIVWNFTAYSQIVFRAPAIEAAE